MEALWKVRDKVRQAHLMKRSVQFGLGSSLVDKAEIRSETALKENRIAWQVTYVPTEIVQANVAYVFIPDIDGPGAHIIGSRDESRQRALSGAVLSDNGHLLAWQDLKKGNSHVLALPLVAKLNSAKSQFPTPLGERNRLGGIDDARLQSQHRPQLANTGKRSLRTGVQFRGSAKGLEELGYEAIKGH
jgi:hypothetical protein